MGAGCLRDDRKACSGDEAGLADGQWVTVIQRNCKNRWTRPELDFNLFCFVVGFGRGFFVCFCLFVLDWIGGPGACVFLFRRFLWAFFWLFVGFFMLCFVEVLLLLGFFNVIYLAYLISKASCFYQSYDFFSIKYLIQRINRATSSAAKLCFSHSCTFLEIGTFSLKCTLIWQEQHIRMPAYFKNTCHLIKFSSLQGKELFLFRSTLNK